MKNIKYSTVKNTVFIAILLGFFIMLFLYNKAIKVNLEKDNLIESSNEAVTIWKNKYGESVAKTMILETENKKTFLAFKTQDSTIKELQKIVIENRKLLKSKGSATIIKSETIIEKSIPTVIDNTQENPIYTSTSQDEWHQASITAKKDTTTFKLKTFHSLSLVIGKEGQGFLKKKKPVAIAKDKNTYSNIKDMKVYNITENISRFVVGPYTGVGMTIIDQQVFLGGQIGFGITYKLFEF